MITYDRSSHNQTESVVFNHTVFHEWAWWLTLKFVVLRGGATYLGYFRRCHIILFFPHHHGITEVFNQNSMHQSSFSTINSLCKTQNITFIAKILQPFTSLEVQSVSDNSPLSIIPPIWLFIYVFVYKYVNKHTNKHFKINK